MVIFISDLLRVTGTMLGLAIGDAMGAPLEGLPVPDQVVDKMTAGGLHDVSCGQYTDDTLQACAVAESLIACGGFSSPDIVRRLMHSYQMQPQFFGPTSRAVLGLVKTGTAPEEAARLVHMSRKWSRSNGSVMRGAPIGIFFQPPRVWSVSMQCSRLTHYDPLAGECSAFVNRLISEMCRGAARDQAYLRALGACRDREVRRMLGCYQEYRVQPSLDALLCTHCSLSVFMQARSFRDAVVMGVNLGGDADTVGAIVGALAGACWGIHAIPEDWMHTLRDRERISVLAYDLWRAGRR